MTDRPRRSSEDRFFFHNDSFMEFCGSPLFWIRRILQGLEDLLSGLVTFVSALLMLIAQPILWVATRWPWILAAAGCLAGLLLIVRDRL